MNNHISHIAGLLNAQSRHLSINKKELEGALEVLFYKVLFPICNEDGKPEKHLYYFYSVFLENLSNLLDKDEAGKIANIFIGKLPEFQSKLYEEAKNFLKNDPAAKSVEEVILTYPGFFALAVHRISHELYNLNVPIIPRLFSEYAHFKVGVDIHPGATIGNLFYIDHGTGIVVGETTVIGENVKIYQGVTLGALFVAKSLKNQKRHPTIEDNVVIYAGATILGGNTVIGHDSTIGGNAWLTKSVVPYSLVFHNSEVKIRNTYDFDDVINFVI
jgi:serine O-acetyltransferase